MAAIIGYLGMAAGTAGVFLGFLFFDRPSLSTTIVAITTVVVAGVLLLGYGAYLLQAAVLHGYRYFTDSVRSPARLWRSCLATLLFAAFLLYFGIRALTVTA